MARANRLLLFRSASKCCNFRLGPFPSLDSFALANIGIGRFFGGRASSQKTKLSNTGQKEAQEALIDYFHLTRGVRLLDAENISYNSNFFLKQLLNKVEIREQEVGRSVSRFLRYHPFNEFEPFFESLGLRPVEISRVLPRNLIYLSDDQSLLDSYYTLSDFGIPSSKIGKIYENSRELFHCNSETLISKLQALSKLGFRNQFFPLFLSRTTQISSDKALRHSIEVTNIIETCGIEMIWIEEQLEDSKIFNWSTMLSVLKFLKAIGYANEQMGSLIKEHPDILFYNSGCATLSMVCFFCKLGLDPSQISATLNNLNKIHVGAFYLNLKEFLNLFAKIGLDADAIGHLFKSHTLLLGSCKIKKASSLLSLLKVGNKYLREVILENPEILRNWAFGCRLGRLERDEKFDERMKSKGQKDKFLLSIGCGKDSPELKRLRRTVRGKASKLQERYNFLVDTVGLSREVVISMIRRYPQIFNMTIDALQRKIKVFVEELKYPLSELETFPFVLCYAPERVRLRVSMYELQKTVTVRKGEFSLSSLLSCSDDTFVRNWVQNYPNGLEIWKEMKKKLYSK